MKTFLKLHHLFLFCAVIFAMQTVLLAEESVEQKPTDGFAWSHLPELPNEHGVAGPFAGVHNDAMIIAGGANFPEGVPWHPVKSGGKSLKQYLDTIYVLVKNGEDQGFKWVAVSGKLPAAVGYGVSVSTSQGVLCIGGETQAHDVDAQSGEVSSSKTLSNHVYLMQWDSKKQKVSVTKKWNVAGSTETLELPQLPIALTNACGAILGDSVYVAGGDAGDGGGNHFFRLSLSPKVGNQTEWKWEPLSSWDGPVRTHAIAVAQKGNFYLFSGRNSKDGKFEILTDAYRFSPSEYEREMSRAKPNATGQTVLPSYANGWKRLADIAPDGETPRCVMAGTGCSTGYDHVLIFGGAAGDILVRREEQIPKELEKAKSDGDETLVAKLQKESDSLYDDHQGFSKDILQYNITTNTWAKRGEMPSSGAVTTSAFRWGEDLLFASGEKVPGIRTRDILMLTDSLPERSFGTANWLVLVTYLLALVVIGLLFARKETNSDTFFLGSKRIPWWAAGLSIYGTALSAITYLAIPARAYGSDWSFSILNFMIPVVSVLVILVYLPKLLRVKSASAYEFLEMRFGISIRLFASCSFVLFQIGRMGVVVLLPALALSAVTGIDIFVSIIAMGVLSTIYTTLGGIEAVIWTDVVQVVVLIGGAIAALFIIVSSIDGGMGTIFHTAYEAGKLNIVNDIHAHDLSWTKDGILVILLASVFNSLIPYTSDQALIQRYMTVKDEKAARAAILTNAWMVVPTTILFFGVGTALWVYYQSHPADLAPLKNPDQIFPWFIAQEMPAGLAGLVIAGVFAAAMSSLDSSMHSSATVITTDFYERFGFTKDKEHTLKIARYWTVILGTLGTVFALILSQLEGRYLWDLFQAILGLLLGTVGGLFSLGILTKRVGTIHAWLGALCSVVLLVYLKFSTDMSGFLYGAVAVSSCMTVALVASYLVPKKTVVREIT